MKNITRHSVYGKLFESPIWDDQRQCLWCVDIKDNKLLALNLDGLVASYDFPGNPSAIFLTDQPDTLLVAAGQEIIKFNIDTARRELWLNFSEEPLHNRFNDGRVIDQQTILLGSMDNNEDLFSGALYRLGTDKSYQLILDEVGISNGCTPVDGKLLATDSKAGWLREFSIKDNNELVFTGRQIDAESLGGCPDGHYVDDQRVCWIALWGGGKVVGLKLATWEVIAEIELPQSNITSCTSVMVNQQRVLWVTSAADESNLASIFCISFPQAGVSRIPGSPLISSDRVSLV